MNNRVSLETMQFKPPAPHYILLLAATNFWRLLRNNSGMSHFVCQKYNSINKCKIRVYDDCRENEWVLNRERSTGKRMWETDQMKCSRLIFREKAWKRPKCPRVKVTWWLWPTLTNDRYRKGPSGLRNGDVEEELCIYQENV